ncbi:unnamed protein product [Prunus brigantina]
MGVMPGSPQGSSRVFGKIRGGSCQLGIRALGSNSCGLRTSCTSLVCGLLGSYGRKDMELINLFLGILHCLNMLLIFDCVHLA